MTRRGHLHLVAAPTLVEPTTTPDRTLRSPAEATRLAAMAGHPAGARRRDVIATDVAITPREAAMTRHPAAVRRERAAARDRHPAGRALAGQPAR
jgi:hypothetical protein